MIFSPQLAAKVLSGEKTVTRRRLTHRDGRPIRYKVNGLYAVQAGRGWPHVGHIRVNTVDVEELRDLTREEAQREGFATIGAFMDYWVKLHRIWNPIEEVARIWFERAPPCERCTEVKA